MDEVNLQNCHQINGVYSFILQKYSDNVYTGIKQKVPQESAAIKFSFNSTLVF